MSRASGKSEMAWTKSFKGYPPVGILSTMTDESQGLEDNAIPEVGLESDPRGSQRLVDDTISEEGSEIDPRGPRLVIDLGLAEDRFEGNLQGYVIETEGKIEEASSGYELKGYTEAEEEIAGSAMDSKTMGTQEDVPFVEIDFYTNSKDCSKLIEVSIPEIGGLTRIVKKLEEDVPFVDVDRIHASKEIVNVPPSEAVEDPRVGGCLEEEAIDQLEDLQKCMEKLNK
jgi:hypothetical protein